MCNPATVQFLKSGKAKRKGCSFCLSGRKKKKILTASREKHITLRIINIIAKKLSASGKRLNIVYVIVFVCFSG